MRRVASVLLYSLLGVVLAASLGAAALAFSADPAQFGPSGLSLEQELEQEVGLPPLEAGGPDELRMWGASYWFVPNEAGGWRITAGRIDKFELEQGRWARRWAVVRRTSVDTPIADEILVLADALRNELPGDITCFDHSAGSVNGRIRGQLFVVKSQGCGPSPVKRQIWDLIDRVPAFSPGG